MNSELLSKPPVVRPLDSEPHAVVDESSVDDVDQLHRSVELATVRRTTRRRGARRLDETVPLLITADLAVAAAVVLIGARHSALLTIAFLATFVPMRALGRSWRPRLHLSLIDDLGLEFMSGVAALGTGAVILMFGSDATLLARLVWLGVSYVVILVAVRAVLFALLRRRRQHESGRRRTLVVGAGPVGRHIAEGLLEIPQFGLAPIGFLDGASGVDDGTLPVPLLSTDPSALGQLIVDHDVRTVIAAFVADDEELIDVMLTSTRLDTDILVVPRLYELASDDAKTDWVNGVPIVRHTSGVTARMSWRVKRMVDCLVATVSLALLSPLLVAAAVGVLVESGRPVLFRQRRIGVDGASFELLKFRSMRPVSEREQQLTWNVAGDSRIGPVGRFLRRTSLDELPQLFNILRGEMSLVGPRPERPAFVAQFTAEHSRYWARHRLPVGLTGWAQVNGLRGDTSIAQRARFDNFYIANWSLWLDFKIILLTVREVLKGSGR